MLLHRRLHVLRLEDAKLAVHMHRLTRLRPTVGVPPRTRRSDLLNSITAPLRRLVAATTRRHPNRQDNESCCLHNHLLAEVAPPRPQASTRTIGRNQSSLISPRAPHQNLRTLPHPATPQYPTRHLPDTPHACRPRSPYQTPLCAAPPERAQRARSSPGARAQLARPTSAPGGAREGGAAPFALSTPARTGKRTASTPPARSAGTRTLSASRPGSP